MVTTLGELVGAYHALLGEKEPVEYSEFVGTERGSSPSVLGAFSWRMPSNRMLPFHRTRPQCGWKAPAARSTAFLGQGPGNGVDALIIFDIEPLPLN